MAFLGVLPGSELFAKVAGNELNRIEREAEKLHNKYMPVNIRDAEVDYDTPQSQVAKLIEQFKDQVRKGEPISLTAKTMSALIDLLRNPTALDDRKHFLELTLVLLSRLPAGGIATKLTNQVTELLYYDLPHPPATYLGNKYRFRTADGSYNNIDVPDLGKANTPYCRSVQAQHPLSVGELPDPQLIYDSLLKRDKFEPHPTGLSNLFFSWATFVIHSIFRTKFENWHINETSSYVDLAPLYGNNQEKQDAVRTSPKDGRGTLKPDTFAEDRLLFLPPATCALLVVFSRNHNYIANKLLELNEQGAWVNPETLKGDDEAIVKKRTQQDDELFNTARCINAFWFAQVVFSDYFSCILGLVRDGSNWNLAPFNEIRKDDHSTVERGRGNTCSIEFNILYRWHATMSPHDEQYIQQEFSQLFNGKPYDSITSSDFGAGMRKVQASLSADPGKWTFGGLTRTESGSFQDEALAGLLKDATARPACAFGARKSPEVMRVIEVMGIEQARTWGACTLNDFRRFLQLKPYTSFEEWNPDPRIANAARTLYGDIEYLELYPGLQAEQTIPVIPGAGLCPPFTIARAILADAIALTRGDRFFTTDATPSNLTAWGFQDVQRDTTNAGFGSMMGRLLLRTLSTEYTSDSVYTWFPFMTPESMQTYLTKLGIDKKYTFDKPLHVESAKSIASHQTVCSILRDKTNFVNPSAERAKDVLSAGATAANESFLTSLNDVKVHQTNLKLIHSSLVHEGFTTKSGSFFYEKTGALITAKSFTLSGAATLTVDIVGDVLQPLTVTYVSEVLAGFPLKTNRNPDGIYLNRELQQMLRDVFSYVYLEADTSKLMRLGELAKSHAQQLLHVIRSNLKPEVPESFFDSLLGHSGTTHVTVDYLKTLRTFLEESNKQDVSDDIFALVLSCSLPLAQAIINVVDFYLQDANTKHRESIVAATCSHDEHSDTILRGYVREALRLSPPIQGVFRRCHASDQMSKLGLTQGQDVFLGIVDANLDPAVFPDPMAVDPSRPAGKYIGLDDALEGIFTKDFVEHVIAQSLRAVYSLKNVRRGPGSTGTLRRINDIAHGLPVHRYLDINRQLSPWTKSMMVQYEYEL